MWRKRPASSRGRQTGSSVLSDSLKPVCFMCGSEHERDSDSSSIFGKKQNIFLTSWFLQHILKACSNVAEASASRGTKMLIDRRKAVVANGNSRPLELSGFCDIWDTV
jgi:hypothetical protein